MAYVAPVESMQPAKNERTILVVDDQAANRALAQAILEDEGYTVVLAASGQEALDAFAASPAECVLLDVRMPGLDGFAVCTQLRALPGGAETPIIFLTASRDVETFDRALTAGGDDFLTKPVRPAELLVRVQTALRLRRLDSERRELFAEVRRQRDSLTRLQLQKEQLSNFLVHDLKNPVASMDLQAQLILRDRNASERSRGAAVQIKVGIGQLLRMILNLLDISKGEEGALRPNRAPTDLTRLAEEVAADMEVQAQASEVRLHLVGAAPTIMADGGLLHRALANLVENAIRHAPEGSEVSIALKGTEDGAEIRVADAGPGVPAALREQIFERFVQLDQGEANSSRSGRGLGLAFCKLAVEAHGGRIWVEDGAPGAVLCLRLPHAP